MLFREPQTVESGKQTFSNGLLRAIRTVYLSRCDGISARYPRNVYDCIRRERIPLGMNLGGTAGFNSCPIVGMGVFCFLKECITNGAFTMARI